MWNIFSKIKELEARVDSLEVHAQRVEVEMDRTLSQMGGYALRSRDELLEMSGTITALLKTVEFLIDRAETEDDLKDAKRLSTRLKHNKTRIKNQLSLGGRG